MQIDNLELRFQRLDPKEFDELSWRIYRVAGKALGHDDPQSAPTRNDRRPDLTWDDAFRIESEICSLLQGARLRREIEARLRFAIARKLPTAADLQTEYTKLISEPQSDEVFRDLLIDILEQIHWASRQKFIQQKVRSQAARRTLMLAVLALVIALSPYVFIGPSTATSPTAKGASFAALWVEQVAWFPDFSAGWPSHFALYTSLMFGFVGALFSRLINLQTNWTVMTVDELYNARAYTYIVLRACIGVVGALIIYFFLQAGVISGSVFPDFKLLSLTTLSNEGSKWPAQLILPSLNLALLIMWSFLAGFSESLVPTVLSSTERQFNAATTTRPS